MQQFPLNSNKKKPFLFTDRDSLLDNIKFNRLDFGNTSSQPSTPIFHSSSRNNLTLDRGGHRSLRGSPLPSRLKNGENYFNEFYSSIKTTEKHKERNNMKDQFKLKKNDWEVNQPRLHKVFGFTIQNNSCVALDPTSGIIAFPAGCVVVGYSAKRSKQFFIHNLTKSPITAISFSRDGKLLATGESGKSPKVRIWNVETRTQVVEFEGHNYKVGALTFSPTSRFIVSIGSQEDITINVWEISSNLRMASSRVTSKVNAVAFSESGQFFVTVGVRHVRFWYLDTNRSKSKTTIALSGRNAILGDFMNNTFNDVGCCSLNSISGVGQMTSSTCSSISNCNNQTYTYVISQAGQLMQFTEQRYLDKWVELQTPKATCISVCESYIMVGCSRGVVLIFDTTSLNHIASFPKPHCLGVNIETGFLDDNVKHDSLRFPDIIAGKYDHIHSRATYFYNDHSLYVWDLRDVHNQVKVKSHLFHSGGVWSVEPVTLGSGEEINIVDNSSFITSSDDGTIRFWHLQDSSSKSLSLQDKKLPSKWNNVYSKELLKILYTDPELKCLTEIDRFLVKNNYSNSVLKHGIRSIKISPDREHLATADREGNLRFYSLNDYKELYSVIAHNGEILSIDYFKSPSAPELILFCSASRDRVIHVMDPFQGYKCIQTIDDHSGAIFSVKLVETPSDQEIRLVSCGMDKSILFRILQPDETGQTAQFFLNQHLVGKQSQYDMVIAPNNRYAAVVCQDRQVRIYNLVTGKQRKSYRGTIGDEGNLLKCAIDPSGTYLATSGSDKYLHILNFTTGEILASLTGHSEMAFGICFLYDLKHLISVSSDNCIFVWRLSKEMTQTMHKRMKELGSPSYSNFPDCDIRKDTAPPSSCGTVTPPRISDDTNMGSSNISICNAGSGDQIEMNSPSTFRFSVSALPSWAQKKFSRRDSITFVQVNMINDFCAGMSTVMERKEESQHNNDDIEKYEVTSRRMSFIATEKVIRDDDSDNMEEEDSEWYCGEKISFDQSTDNLPRLSTEFEDDEDDEEDSLMCSKQSILQPSLPSGGTETDNSDYFIQTHECSDTQDSDLSSSNSPSFNPVIEPKVEQLNTNMDSDTPVNLNNFDFDETLTVDDSNIGNSRLARSLTTRYLSKNSSGLNNINSQSKLDHGTNDRSIERPTEASALKIISSNVHHSTKKSLQEKSMSEVNVSQIGTIYKKSELGSTPNANSPVTVKANFHSSKRNKERSHSPDKKLIKKKSIEKTTEKKILNKSFSISSVASIDPCTDSRPKSGTLTKSFRKSFETKFVSNKPIINPSCKTNRPKWGDSKTSRVIRKTCPVDNKDIKNANSLHSTSFKSFATHESLGNDKKFIQLSFNSNKIDLMMNTTKDKEESNTNSHTFSKGASFDLNYGAGKEHMINEIEEALAPNVSLCSNINFSTSPFEEMLKSFPITMQTEFKESGAETLGAARLISVGGECELVKSLDLEDLEECTDEWISDLCDGHNLDFLTTMVSKILQRLINNPEINNDTQIQIANRLLTEIDRVYHQLRSTLDLVPKTLDSEAATSLIRDIGEKIVDEVKRRMSESL